MNKSGGDLHISVKSAFNSEIHGALGRQGFVEKSRVKCHLLGWEGGFIAPLPA